MADTSKSIVDNLLTLNFLAGKRTYLIGLLVFAQAVIGFFTGEITFGQFWTQLPELAFGPAIMSLRAGMPK